MNADQSGVLGAFIGAKCLGIQHRMRGSSGRSRDVWENGESGVSLKPTSPNHGPGVVAVLGGGWGSRFYSQRNR